MKGIYKIKFHKYWSDWTDTNEFEIKLDDIDYFEIQERFGGGIYLYCWQGDKRTCVNELFDQHCLAEPYKVFRDLHISKFSAFSGHIEKSNFLKQVFK